MKEYLTAVISCNDCDNEFVILKDGDFLPDDMICPICQNTSDFTYCTRKIIVKKLLEV
jgi:hypothetical protein